MLNSNSLFNQSRVIAQILSVPMGKYIALRGKELALHHQKMWSQNWVPWHFWKNYTICAWAKYSLHQLLIAVMTMSQTGFWRKMGIYQLGISNRCQIIHSGRRLSVAYSLEKWMLRYGPPEDKVWTTQDTSYRLVSSIHRSSVFCSSKKKIGLDKIEKKEKSTEYKSEGKEEGKRGIN